MTSKSVKLADLRAACEHGRRSAHKTPGDPPVDPGIWCPGGRPVTLEELKQLVQELTEAEEAET